MTRLFANARMYAVTPDIEAAWRGLLGDIAREAGVEFTYLPYPAPRPLEDLWTRPDLGCAFMCGYPIALRLAAVTPLAAPIPLAPWAEGKAVYRSDLIVRADSGIERIEDSFGKRAGWTVAHSHSGFNAFRHHLLPYRSPARQRLYAAIAGDLVTARRVLDLVVSGDVDIGPLDAYWHLLLRRERPELFEKLRLIASTACAPMPALVAGPQVNADMILRLKEAFSQAAHRPWFRPYGERLQILGFQPVERVDFAQTLVWRDEALAAGYPLPA